MFIGKLDKRVNANGDLLLTLNERHKEGVLVTNFNFGSFHFHTKKKLESFKGLQFCLYDENDNFVYGEQIGRESLYDSNTYGTRNNYIRRGMYFSVVMGCFVMLPTYKIVVTGLKEFIDEAVREKEKFDYSDIDCYLSFVSNSTFYGHLGGLSKVLFNKEIVANKINKDSFFFLRRCKKLNGRVDLLTLDIIKYDGYSNQRAVNYFLLSKENYDKKFKFNGKEITFSEFLGVEPNLSVSIFDKGGVLNAGLLPFGYCYFGASSDEENRLDLDEYFNGFVIERNEVIRKSQLWFLEDLRNRYLACLRENGGKSLLNEFETFDMMKLENLYQDLSEIRYEYSNDYAVRLPFSEFVAFDTEVPTKERDYSVYSIDTGDLKEGYIGLLKLDPNYVSDQSYGLYSSGILSDGDPEEETARENGYLTNLNDGDYVRYKEMIPEFVSSVDD